MLVELDLAFAISAGAIWSVRIVSGILVLYVLFHRVVLLPLAPRFVHVGATA